MFDVECSMFIPHFLHSGAHSMIALPTSPATRRALRPLAQTPPRPIEWLWPDRIALGKLSLICGEPGIGKSLIAVFLAAHVSDGEKWPDGSPVPQGTVIYLSAEDAAEDTLAPRVHA